MDGHRYFLNKLFFASVCFLPFTAQASFIESTMGTAVVNDATATYYNPAALVVLKNPQFIGLGSAAQFHTQFTGQVIQAGTGFNQSGTASSNTNYYLPTFYFATPLSSKISFGVAIITNFFNKEVEDDSILRYAQSSNNVEDVDLVPAIGFKLNEFASFGLGLNFSHARFLMAPTSGFPTLNIPDEQSNNSASSNGVGADAGFLLKINPATVLGFNYRSAITYHFTGSSVLQGTNRLVSNQYHFKFWTPARSVVSISHFLNPKFGLIGTAQWIQWSVFSNVHAYNVATQVGVQPQIVNATIPFYMRNSWLFTVGGLYRVDPKWVVRVAGTFSQAANNPHYQISNGNGFILGGSTGYDINKYLTIDASYAHEFIQNQSINIVNARNIVNGINKAYRDAISLKLTVNV